MADKTLCLRSGSVALVFVIGCALGWLGASHQAVREARARDSDSFEGLRRRIDEESMRRLDLSREQRQIFLNAWDAAHLEMDRTMGRLRPEIDSLLRRIDQRVRPVLNPRQLAVYDQIEAERRSGLPERPMGDD
ncbi:hypothetical protein [Solidesulfovibrio sp.]